MQWYKMIKIREGVGRLCIVMALKARGSEILLFAGVYSCPSMYSYVCVCKHTFLY